MDRAGPGRAARPMQNEHTANAAHINIAHKRAYARALAPDGIKYHLRMHARTHARRPVVASCPCACASSRGPQEIHASLRAHIGICRAASNYHRPCCRRCRVPAAAVHIFTCFCILCARTTTKNIECVMRWRRPTRVQCASARGGEDKLKLPLLNYNQRLRARPHVMHVHARRKCKTEEIPSGCHWR